MKSLVTIILLFISITCSSQEKIKFTAAGVTCSMCSNAIHNALKQNHSIEKIEPNLQTQEWIVIFKPKHFNNQSIKIIEKSVNDAGFSISKLYLNDSLVIDKSKRKKNGKNL